MTNKGKLYLIPVPFSDHTLKASLPDDVISIVKGVNHFLVEDAKSARAFLKTVGVSVQNVAIQALESQEDAVLLSPLFTGADLAVISEAGCPAIADPGGSLVMLAHKQGIQVIPLVGPSSILLGLMASGLNGQRFCFLGYLPREKSARITAIKAIEHRSYQNQETQIFIETPYRNKHLFQDILQTCRENSQLCVASSLTLTEENIMTRTIRDWKKQTSPDLDKKPTVFLLLAGKK